MNKKIDQPIISNIFFKEDLFDSDKFNLSQKKILWCLLRGMHDHAVDIDNKKVLICTYSDLAHMSSLKEVTARYNMAQLIQNNIVSCERLLTQEKIDYGKNNCFWIDETLLKEIVYGDKKMVFDRFGGKLIKKGVSRRLTNLENLVRQQTELLERLHRKDVGGV